LQHGADFGIAFDGDFDRCFFFDEKGTFVSGEYIVGLLASVFLDKEPYAKIVHDPRVIWNIQDIVKDKGGFCVPSQTGHAFIKQTMRKHQAVYGGELSAHHYFRDFSYCDSGMIPWLLILEILSKSGTSLGALVKSRHNKFPSSGEINFTIKDPDKVIDLVKDHYSAAHIKYCNLDGLSLEFEDWRLNLRKSNTEPLVRLNIECRKCKSLVDKKVREVSALINSTH
jgi:phosphomannomutase